MDRSRLHADLLPSTAAEPVTDLQQKLVAAETELKIARAEAEALKRELKRAEQGRLAVNKENAIAREQLSHLEAELAQIHQSLGWAIIKKSRNIRARMIRGHHSGRYWNACSRILKNSLSAGPRGVIKQIAALFEKTPHVTDRHTANDTGKARGLGATPGSTRLLGDLKVSVIVPNFNHARYLEERLSCIFAQTFRPHEIIFLDDASSDDSINVAHTLAARSPVPFRMIANETNSGSTFRQWLKGIGLATGNLIWIAESDDACRPDFLERLVPEFLDAAVALAYSQSAVIGPKGQTYHSDYLFHTDDISPTRWRSRYCVSGLEEVEIALSQKTTIPNASAVVFRKPAVLDFSDDISQLKLMGDLFFYVMQAREGKVAFLPEALNFHRWHNKTVRRAFEYQISAFREQLFVKSRTFETFPVSAGAITRSLIGTIREYAELTQAAKAQRPALTAHPDLAPFLGRIRSSFQSRHSEAPGRRILLVVSDMQEGIQQMAAIRLANALAGRCQVYLSNARPMILSPAMAGRIDERIILIEGTLGISSWMFGEGSARDATAFESAMPARALVLEELIRFHQIDVLHSHGWWAHRLVYAANGNLGIPWLVSQIGDKPDNVGDRDGEPAFDRLVGAMLSTVQGAFYTHPDDLEVFSRRSIPQPRHLVRIFDGADSGVIEPDEDQDGDDPLFERIAMLTEKTYNVAETELRGYGTVSADGDRDR